MPQFSLPTPRFASTILVAGLLAWAGASSPASAVQFTETTDAGATIATAINVGPGIDVIRGSQSGSDDVDVFAITFAQNVAFTAFNLVWDSPNISLSTIELTDGVSAVLSQCDDCFFNQGNQGTQILAANLAAGTYYVHINDDSTGGSELGGYSLQIAPATSAIPEPATLALLATGFLGLAATRRRRDR